jgi:hypothetical protein
MTETENPLGILWGAKEIGRFIGKKPRAAFWLLENGQIPGRKQGKMWTSTKGELQEALTASAKPPAAGDR